jgi:hypothetical protein
MGFKKPKISEENFNGSCLSGNKTYKVNNLSNSTNAPNNSISSSSFNELVKGVNLSNMNKKKKSK